VQDIHFPGGNEFLASAGDQIDFVIEMAYFNVSNYPDRYIPQLCKGDICLGQDRIIKNRTQPYPTLVIFCQLVVQSDSFYGTWGLYISQHVGMETGRYSSPLLAHIHVNKLTQGEKEGRDDILWCHDSETINYVKLDGPPRCPLPQTMAAPTEMGSLTIYVDNYKVQTQPAWTCKVIVHKIRMKCVHLQQTKEPQRDSIESVDVDVCRQWYRDKSCKYGSMTSFGNPGWLSWKTDNPLKVSYNHWNAVCGWGGKPRYYTSYNCLMDEVDITYQSPFVSLFSAATGSLPLESLTTHGMKKTFKTIAWSPESSNAFRHVCRKVISLTLRVTKTTYSDRKAASQHKALHGSHIRTNNTVYQFMAADSNAVLYVVQEKDRTSLKAIDAGSCGDEYPDTFVSNSLILQYVTDSYLAISGKARYTGVNHYPTSIDFQHDPEYAKANEHTNSERTSDASDILMCGATNMKSDTHECQGGKAVSKRMKREVNPEIPDIIQARLDYLEAKQIESSQEWVRQLTHQACLEQRRIHFLQTMQLDIDPSATFSSYAKQHVHVVPRGDIYSLQHCVRLDCTTIHVIPSLKTTYPPMREVYEEKGVFISEHMAFYRPIVQFIHTVKTVTAQLQTKHYVNPYLTYVTRYDKKKHRESKENPVLDIKFFEICGQYYIFEENILVSTVKVAEAGTEQHIIREYTKHRVNYSEEVDGSGQTISMIIKSFATFAPAHLTVPEAAFYGLRKASYYTQDAILSQVYSLRDAIAATMRLTDTVIYTEAQVGREDIHSTVNMMGDILGGLRDISVAGGEAIGGFVGSAIGSATGMAVESFTDMAASGISTFMDSIFSRVVQIIGIVGGYWAIVVTLIYLAIAGYKKNFNIFAKSSDTKGNWLVKKGKPGYTALNNEDVPQESTYTKKGKDGDWTSWVTQ
jgi:hypothetical protein